MISEWYGYFSIAEHCSIPTLILFFLVFLAWFSFIWDHSNNPARKPTTSDMAQVYVSGGVCFFVGTTILGYLIVPDNAQGLLELLGLKGFLVSATYVVQGGILWVLKAMI